MCYSHNINQVNNPTQHKFEQEDFEQEFEQEFGEDFSVCVLNLAFV